MHTHTLEEADFNLIDGSGHKVASKWREMPKATVRAGWRNIIVLENNDSRGFWDEQVREHFQEILFTKARLSGVPFMVALSACHCAWVRRADL